MLAGQTVAAAIAIMRRPRSQMNGGGACLSPKIRRAHVIFASSRDMTTDDITTVVAAASRVRRGRSSASVAADPARPIRRRRSEAMERRSTCVHAPRYDNEADLRRRHFRSSDRATASVGRPPRYGSSVAFGSQPEIQRRRRRRSVADNSLIASGCESPLRRIVNKYAFVMWSLDPVFINKT